MIQSLLNALVPMESSLLLREHFTRSLSSVRSQRFLRKRRLAAPSTGLRCLYLLARFCQSTIWGQSCSTGRSSTARGTYTRLGSSRCDTSRPLSTRGRKSGIARRFSITAENRQFSEGTFQATTTTAGGERPLETVDGRVLRDRQREEEAWHVM